MSPILSLESHPDWRHNSGKRFLKVNDFIQLCEAVGLYSCSEPELEEYERKGWMFPAARMVMPEDYARACWMKELGVTPEFELDEELIPYHELDWAIRYQIPIPNAPPVRDSRHPIDRSWDQVEGLERPIDREYLPWDDYMLALDERDIRLPTATHFYHYWQVYELYHVRRFRRRMYQDNAPVLLPRELVQDGFGLLSLHFDALSYFQHLYQAHRNQMFENLQPDEDGWIPLTQQQQMEWERAAHGYAADTLQVFKLDEDGMYSGLRTMMQLHHSYEQSERIRLAEALKADLWRAVEFIHLAFGTLTEDIAARAGRVGGYTENYLALLFPNRREETRRGATRVLQVLTREHNRQAPNHSISDIQIELILDYVEGTDLALFEYILVEVNDAHFARHSWHAAEAFLRLKSLASFPESLMRILLLGSEDAAAIGDGMGTLNQTVFRNSRPGIWREYENARRRRAHTVDEFRANLAHLITLISVANTEEGYLGASLSLATLLRNFTSHVLVEDPTLLQGQYVRCVRAVITTAFLAWRVAQSRDWI